ncbi:MAG TPA: D-alanine--D-alanine ligase [Planctomycetota bacterium]|nr:D-alanine--D-alanine ligase [Planctomycetota bacterium]
MLIGIAYDLKSDFAHLAKADSKAPDDLLEEFDSLATIEGIEGALTGAGHRVVRLGGGKQLVRALLERPVDLVFNIAEGFGSRSREAHVPALCEMLGVPYTHSDPLTCATTLDKGVAKRLVQAAGIPTAGFAVIEDLRDIETLALEFPLFAKPLCEGSSMGIRDQKARCDDRAALAERVGSILAAYGQPALVEEFLPGVEATVGILGTGKTARILGTMEVVPLREAPADFVYSIDVKRDVNFAERIEYVVPPRQPPALIALMEEVALSAYRVLGCRDVGRVDLRVARDGTPKFLEVNPLPGLKPGWSDLAILAGKAGMEYEQLILAIVAGASQRLGLRA